MNTIKAVCESQRQIMSQITEAKMMVSKLYDRFGEMLPEHTEFWNDLALHAQSIALNFDKMPDILDNGYLFIGIGSVHKKLMDVGEKLLTEFYDTLERDGITHLQALLAAMQLESMCIHSGFWNSVACDAPEFSDIANNILIGTERDLSMIKEQLMKQSSDTPTAKCNGSDKNKIEHTFSIHHSASQACIIGKFDGVMDVKAMRKYIKRVIDVGGKFDCKHFLNDMREAETRLSEPTIYDMCGMLHGIGMDRSWIRAVLLTGRHDDCEMFEQMALSSGYTMRIFIDKEEAINWLNSKC